MSHARRERQREGNIRQKTSRHSPFRYRKGMKKEKQYGTAMLMCMCIYTCITTCRSHLFVTNVIDRKATQSCRQTHVNRQSLFLHTLSIFASYFPYWIFCIKGRRRRMGLPNRCLTRYSETDIHNEMKRRLSENARRRAVVAIFLSRTRFLSSV